MFSPSTHALGEQWIQSTLQKQMIPGFLGRADQGGTYSFAVPGRPGFTFCRLWDGEITSLSICVNMVAPLDPNNMVWLHRVGGVLTVAYSDPVSAANLFQGNVGIGGVPPHVATEDTSPVVGGRILDLDVHAPDPAFAGLNVCVEAGLTAYGYLLRRSDYDVSSYLSPTSGMRRWALVYVDTDGTVKFSVTGSVETATPASDMLLDNGGNTAIAALESLTISPGWQPLAGIVLDNGQTVVDANTRIVDWRMHFAAEANTNVGTLEVTDGVNDVLGVTKITVTGATVGGSTPNATLTVTGGGGSGTDLCIIQDRKTQNTAGGTFTSGGDRTRDLNTIVTNEGSHVSLSSNQFTPAAGTYRIHAEVPAWAVQNNQAWLYNVTDSAIEQSDLGVDLLGTSTYSEGTLTDTVICLSIIDGRFTTDGTKVFEIRHRCALTKTTTGFGVASNLHAEIYTTVRLEKEA